MLFLAGFEHTMWVSYRNSDKISGSGSSQKVRIHLIPNTVSNTEHFLCSFSGLLFLGPDPHSEYGSRPRADTSVPCCGYGPKTVLTTTVPETVA
jgi:hypothetical protein